MDGTSHLIGAKLLDASTVAVKGTTTKIGFAGTRLTGISVQDVMWSYSATTHHVDRSHLT